MSRGKREKSVPEIKYFYVYVDEKKDLQLSDNSAKILADEIEEIPKAINISEKFDRLSLHIVKMHSA